MERKPTHEAQIAIYAIRAFVSSDFEVSISDAHVPREGVRTVMDVAVPIPLGVDKKCAWLLFIDLSPLAEWAHSCLYFFIDDKGAVSRPRKESYPPTQKEGLRLTQLPGPYDPEAI